MWAWANQLNRSQTTERVEKALATLQSIERFACDQHDHVSFAKAWMLMGKGVAHALDYDFILISPAVMFPLQRRSGRDDCSNCKGRLAHGGIAVDEYEASLVCGASPWAADKSAAEIVRPALVQSADWVPPKGLARDMAFAKLL